MCHTAVCGSRLMSWLLFQYTIGQYYKYTPRCVFRPETKTGYQPRHSHYYRFPIVSIIPHAGHGPAARGRHPAYTRLASLATWSPCCSPPPPCSAARPPAGPGSRQSPATRPPEPMPRQPARSNPAAASPAPSMLLRALLLASAHTVLEAARAAAPTKKRVMVWTTEDAANTK